MLPMWSWMVEQHKKSNRKPERGTSHQRENTNKIRAQVWMGWWGWGVAASVRTHVPRQTSETDQPRQGVKAQTRLSRFWHTWVAVHMQVLTGNLQASPHPPITAPSGLADCHSSLCSVRAGTWCLTLTCPVPSTHSRNSISNLGISRSIGQLKQKKKKTWIHLIY